MRGASVVQAGNGLTCIDGGVWINGKKVEPDGTPRQVIADGRETHVITLSPQGGVSISGPGGCCASRNMGCWGGRRTSTIISGGGAAASSAQKQTRKCDGETIHGDHRNVDGDGNNVLGDYCNVRGDGNNVVGDYCYVRGDGNNVRGDGNNVTGDGNNVMGDYCHATGIGNSVSGEYSTNEDPRAAATSSKKKSTRREPSEAPKKRRPKKISHIADVAGQPSPKERRITVHGQVNTGGVNVQTLGGECKIAASDDNTDAVIFTEIGADEKCSDNETPCCVCMDNRRKLLIQECGHVCLCFGCAKKLIDRHDAPVACPMCKTKIAKKMMRAFV